MRRIVCVFVGCLVGCSTVAEEMTGDASTGAAAEGTTEAGTVLNPTSGAGTTGSGETNPGGSGTTIDDDGGTTGGGSSGGTTGDEPGPEPTAGCGMPALPAGPQDRMIAVAGMDRHYILVVPNDYDSGKAYPLVFAWHGRGGDSSGARLYFGIEKASAGQAIFVYPDGLPLPEMDNQTGWDLTEDGEDVALFDAILAEVGGTMCVDAGRVFSAGHSFGGFMSNALGCFRGGTVRAIGLVAGGGPYGLQCTGQVASWLTHGTLDMVVPFTNGEASRDHWVAANHCEMQADPVAPAPCVAYAGCDAGFPVHWCQHDDPAFSGHTWPAWAGAGIWNFFAAL